MEICFAAHQEPKLHEPCDNCSIIKELLSFKQDLYASSFSFSMRQSSEFYKRTVEALDNDYRSDLIEVFPFCLRLATRKINTYCCLKNLVAACVVVTASDDSWLSQYFDDVAEYQVISIEIPPYLNNIIPLTLTRLSIISCICNLFSVLQINR